MYFIIVPILSNVKSPYTSLIITSSSVTFPPTLHHHPLCVLQSPSLFHLSTQPLTTLSIFITPEAITWLSFDSIIYSFGSLLHPWSSGTVTLFVFERSSFHHHILNFLSPDSPSHHTTISPFYHHLYHLYQYFSHNLLQIRDSKLPIIDSTSQSIGSKLPTTSTLPIIDINIADYR